MEERLHEPQRIWDNSLPLLKYDSPEKLEPPVPKEQKKENCNEEEKILEEEEDKWTIREILDIIFPPRRWMDQDGYWMQSVSDGRISRNDVFRLQEQLEFRLEERKAKLEGYCPIRRWIYHELIRQEIIMCPERGYLLSKIRDEFKLWESAMNAMYENSVIYGVKKNVEAKHDLASVSKSALNEGFEHETTTKEIQNIQDAIIMAEKRYEENMTHLENKFKEKIDFYTKLNNTIQAQINAITQPRKFLIPMLKSEKRPSDISQMDSSDFFPSHKGSRQTYIKLKDSD